MDGVLEIITGRERRRRWRTDEKLRIVAALEEPGARVCDVAARYDVCESLVFTWRRQAREGLLATVGAPVFVPMQMIDAQADRPSLPPHSAPAAVAPTLRSQAGMIEIELGDGRRVRVDSEVNLSALRRVLTALKA
jgi:transposase